MASSIEALFERELERRKISFTRDPESHQYSVQAGTTALSVSLENLAREYASDGAPNCVPRFVEAILHGLSDAVPEWDLARRSVLFSLEPNDYAQSSDLRVAISKRIDRVPVLIDQRFGTQRWVTRDMAERWGISVGDITAAALANIAVALASATTECNEIDGVTLGYFETELPMKSSLLLAPNLKEVVGKIIGWPLHAVVPDQQFVYIWPARHERFFEQVGAVVLREYSQAPHPVTMELLKIDDGGMQAIGAFA